MLKVLKKEVEYLLTHKPDKISGHEFEYIFSNYIISVTLIESLIPYIEVIKDKYFYSYAVDNIWSSIARHQYLPIDFCIKYADKLGYKLYENKSISVDSLVKVLEVDETNTYWYKLSQRNDITAYIANKYKDNLRWFNLLQNNDYSEEFIREHIEYINWESLCSYYELSENFINDFKNLIDWQFATIHQHLSEKILRENSFRFNKREWRSVSKYQKLSEQFILDFIDKLDLNLVTQYQYLSDDFIDANRDKLKLVNLHLNPYVSKMYLLKLQAESKLQKKEKKLISKIFKVE